MSKSLFEGRRLHFFGIAFTCALAAILAGCFIDAVIDVNDAGRIWSESGTIDCSSTNPEQSDCQEEYLGGGEELFFAQPDPGHKFLGWNMGHCTGVGSCYVPWSEEDGSGSGTGFVEADFAPINPQPQTVSYLYNAMGQRVAKTVNGVTTLYVYDIYGQLIAELDSNGNTLREYVYFDGQVIAHVESSGGNYDGIHYVLNDHLGRPMKVLRDPTDPTNPGETLWAMETEAFGEETGTFQQAGFSHNKRFPGQYYDQETGLSYNYYRDYDPSIGRYIQSDPIGLQGGANTYGYALQSPVMGTDRYGLITDPRFPEVLPAGWCFQEYADGSMIMGPCSPWPESDDPDCPSDDEPSPDPAPEAPPIPTPAPPAPPALPASSRPSPDLDGRVEADGRPCRDAPHKACFTPRKRCINEQVFESIFGFAGLITSGLGAGADYAGYKKEAKVIKSFGYASLIYAVSECF